MNKHPQKATVWRGSGFNPDGSTGWNLIGTFDVRWEDSQTLRLSGIERFTLSRSIVFFPEDVFEIGDRVFEGVSTSLSPEPKSFEVKDKMRTPNLSGTTYEYKAII